MPVYCPVFGTVSTSPVTVPAFSKVKVVDTNGNPVDLSGFVATEDEEEVVAEAEEIADAAADADAVIEAEEAEAAEKPAKKAPAKKPAAKKAPAKKAADAE